MFTLKYVVSSTLDVYYLFRYATKEQEIVLFEELLALDLALGFLFAKLAIGVYKMINFLFLFF